MKTKPNCNGSDRLTLVRQHIKQRQYRTAADQLITLGRRAGHPVAVLETWRRIYGGLHRLHDLQVLEAALGKGGAR